MKKFLMFDLMIAPWVIRILYWFYQTAILIFGIYLMFGGRDNYFDSGMRGPLSGLIVIVLGSLASRILFEILMVPFKICENTSQIKDNQEVIISGIKPKTQSEFLPGPSSTRMTPSGNEDNEPKQDSRYEIPENKTQEDKIKEHPKFSEIPEDILDLLSPTKKSRLANLMDTMEESDVIVFHDNTVKLISKERWEGIAGSGASEKFKLIYKRNPS